MTESAASGDAPAMLVVRGLRKYFGPSDRPVRAVDIGSGLGGLVLELARRRPDSVFMGIELAPLPWLLSWLRAMATPSRSWARTRPHPAP